MYSFDFVYNEQSSACCVQIDIMVIKFDILVFDFVPDCNRARLISGRNVRLW